MSEPKLQYKVSYAVSCHDLDKFVNMHLEGFGRTWHCLETGYNGYHNGSFRSADVKAGAVIEDDLDQDFDRWLTGSGPFYLDTDDDYYTYDLPGIEHILQWLCNQGKIPEGNYVVEMWW